MIEIEKKFHLTKEAEAQLIKGAKELGESEFSDTYYDKTSYPLAKKDIWLRSRNGRWQLKIGEKGSGTKEASYLNQYEELAHEDTIRKALSVEKYGSLARDLETEGYVPIATFTTVRKKFKKGGFNIDIDQASFDDFRIIEIELHIETPKERKRQQKR